VVFRRRRPREEEIAFDDPTQLPSLPGGPLEPLAKAKRQPAQEKIFKELTSINERIASLVQVRQMGLATSDNKIQLKQLMQDRKKKSFQLKRLQCKQKSSNKYRDKRKKIVKKNILFIYLFQKHHELLFFLLFRSNIYSIQNRNYIRN